MDPKQEGGAYRLVLQVIDQWYRYDADLQAFGVIAADPWKDKQRFGVEACRLDAAIAAGARLLVFVDGGGLFKAFAVGRDGLAGILFPQ